QGEGTMQKQSRLLLVEDDPEIATVVRDMLVREGYFVTWATTGLEGWEDFQADAYDLVSVDLMLPEMDGFKLCRNSRWKSNIRMIMISARQEEAVKIEGLGLGADDYVAKPFSLDELKARIQSHLRRWQRYQGNLSLMKEQVTTSQGRLVIYEEIKKDEINDMI